jgi:hypothetical protein
MAEDILIKERLTLFELNGLSLGDGLPLPTIRSNYLRR